MDELRKIVLELQTQVAALQARVRAQDAELATLKQAVADRDVLLAQKDARIAELESQVAELSLELQRRKKGFSPKANVRPKRAGKKDRRRKGERKHPGVVRPEALPGPDAVEHDVRGESCPGCGGALDDTGEFEESVIEDIPHPQPEVHVYRRHRQRCRCCRKVTLAPLQSEVADAYIGPRTKLFVGYCRAHLGISLGKTVDLLDQLFGLSLSRSGALGHVLWSGELVNPVVQKLLEILRTEPVVHADETGWRINGRNVWIWCFCNPRLALFLVDKHRSAAVVQRVLGDSIPGILVTDFYASYNALDCRKQKCLSHLLRELHTLREEAPRGAVSTYLQPLITVLQDAIALAKARDTQSKAAFTEAREGLENRLEALIQSRPTHPDCARINKRLVKYRFDLFRFLDEPLVTPDNNLGERDIRSVAATRADGGVNRSAAGAKAFANLKSVIRTCQKHGRNFLAYGLQLASRAGSAEPVLLPFDST